MPRVLVVDTPDEARTLAASLRVEGFDVRVAHDAESAVRAFTDEAVDLVLVELMLPGQNGLELARTLAAKRPDARVILTGNYHLSERQLVRCDCRPCGFVPKPFSLEELVPFLRSKLPPPPASSARRLPTAAE
jgi:two-component system OmpR family response regulator